MICNAELFLFLLKMSLGEFKELIVVKASTQGFSKCLVPRQADSSIPWQLASNATSQFLPWV